VSATADDAFDRRVREAIASSIRRRGSVPAIAQVATDMQVDGPLVRASFDRMSAAHVFIPQRGSSEIYSYNPFCAEHTDFRVRSDGREWWALCGWDALGIPAALAAAGRVETSCLDCGESVVIDVDRDGTAVASPGTVMNVGVRALDFWKDIYFT
jgi:Alkylmercury lyase